MAVSWDKYHVGFDGYGNRLFLGRIETIGNKVKWSSKSEDRTEEIINMVITKLKASLEAKDDPDKPYSGYHIEGVGDLLFVDDNYTYDIRPKGRTKR